MKNTWGIGVRPGARSDTALTMVMSFLCLISNNHKGLSFTRNLSPYFVLFMKLLADSNEK